MDICSYFTKSTSEPRASDATSASAESANCESAKSVPDFSTPDSRTESVPVISNESTPSPIPTKRMRLVDNSDSDCDVEKPDSSKTTKRQRGQRGKGKKHLSFLLSSDAITTDSLNNSAFKDFTVIDGGCTKKQTAKTGKHELTRAPLAKAARPRAISVVLHNEKEAGAKKKSWDPQRFENKSAHSYCEILELVVGCHENLHKRAGHICKKGKTFAECGVRIKDGHLYCCGKRRKPKINALTDHVSRKCHDK